MNVWLGAASVVRCAFALIALAALAIWTFPLAHARAADSVADRDEVIATVRSFWQARAASVDGRAGIAVADVAEPGALPMFVDAMKQASPWSSARALRLDALGNVVALAPGQSAQTLLSSSGSGWQGPTHCVGRRPRASRSRPPNRRPRSDVLLLGFAAAMRRTKIVAFDVGDLTFAPEGLSVLALRFIGGKCRIQRSAVRY